MTEAGSTPAVRASTAASPRTAMFTATMAWLASLAMLPAPIGPTSVTELPHEVEDLADPVEVRLRTADHEGQGALDRAGLSAGDRRVEHADTALGERLMEATADRGGDRAHVHQKRSRCGTLEDAVLAEHDLLDIGAVPGAS